jgi:hypothetical protein
MKKAQRNKFVAAFYTGFLDLNVQKKMRVSKLPRVRAPTMRSVPQPQTRPASTKLPPSLYYENTHTQKNEKKNTL